MQGHVPIIKRGEAKIADYGTRQAACLVEGSAAGR